MIVISPEKRYIFKMSEKTKTQPKTPEWPNTIRSRAELDAALEAGLKSGISERSFDQIVEDAIARAKHG
jgi:hypothetical protein